MTAKNSECFCNEKHSIINAQLNGLFMNIPILGDQKINGILINGIEYVIIDEVMSIILAMPGKRENQERFWQRCILDTGLEFYTQLAFQANAKWNDKYPADLLAAFDDPSHIALEQYKHTKSRFDS